ncbi:RAMP superfamily CRISPR-associated protein [uncultured Thermomonospora sp.]|uniref:RAMP superfamily CRISPR-associated protein n=1 Tax=uncultured Thermomonospora sp. TaxID=671175 RepID=UPI00259BDE2D|nr:RAMP superfamily CRISPR-associated protein [uncultured Thermomonospora sp.]
MTTIALTLRMLSDWHIGTGTTLQGHLNRQVLRDEHGLPYVPAKTLNGVWRDACEVAAHALDSGPSGIWHEWVEYLFGSQHPSPEEAARHPKPAALRLGGPLRLPGALGPALAGRRKLRDAVTFVRPGVAIDPRTGTAAEDKLRFDEMARGGLSLAGTAELPDALSERERGCAMALLWAGAVLVEGIGAKRRRGAGRCRLEPSGPGMPPGPQRLQELVHNPVPPPRPEEPTGTSHASGPVRLRADEPNDPAGTLPAVPEQNQAREPQASGPARLRADEPDGSTATPPSGAGRPQRTAGWERVLLRIELLTPLIAYDRTVGNAVQGRDHAPGWMLLREVLHRVGSPEAHAAARRGDLVVTPATPMVDGMPGRPVPRVLAQAKDAPELFRNRMAERDGASGQVFKRVRAGYLPAAGGGRLTLHRPQTTLRMHNTIADASQRPTARLGGVYVYQALAAGTVLGAEVRVRAGLLEAGWHERLPGPWRLGRSRKDDYGLVDVTVVPDVPAGPPHRDLRAGDRLKVWLLSDTLVRNARLTPSTDPADLARALQAAFADAGAPGVVLKSVDEDDGLLHASFEVARTDSWHTGWRLPRPTLLGFAAGGCLEFEVVSGWIGAEALAAVELAGVGERRGEGFGQIRLNDPLLEKTAPAIVPEPAVPQPATAQGEPPSFEPGGPGYAEAQVIETAAWRTEIWRLCEERAADPTNPVLRDLTKLSSSQLNGLRGLLNHLEEPEPRLRKRIDRLTCRWSNDSGAREDLKALLLDPDQPWRRLRLPEADLTLTADGARRLRRELRAEALRSLLTACLAAHTRRQAHASPQEAR